ncbi:hypothetical protein [Saccharococcus thermophilus]|uniref:Uncharacterized protein n=1 Tax=Saccharococcus thermophilus TaxID=29396 RepID=A0A846MLH8_9BACL|nr:hypothetical protein [Saccharococcus thermophilus]NIK16491.1 hypothetical protein [Saccharococcus thermophilus]
MGKIEVELVNDIPALMGAKEAVRLEKGFSMNKNCRRISRWSFSTVNAKTNGKRRV